MNDLEYRCPRCRGALAAGPAQYDCRGCVARFPIVYGIPDFRLYPDPYIAIEDDYRKAGRLIERYAESTFRELVEFYWSITPDTPPEMARRFTAHALAGTGRGRWLLDDLAASNPAGRGGPGRRALEVGCRTGGVLAAMAERFGHVVGIDIAFRWLIVARKALEESGQRAQLACCCAENLPFEEGALHLVLAENVLEHARTPAALVTEAHRALAPGGVLYATTWNRLSPAPEPHVRLFGVGYLPRGLQKRYVRYHRGVDYEHVRLVSAFGLTRIARAAGFRSASVRAAALSPAQVAALPRLLRPGVLMFRAMRDVPGLRGFLAQVAPILRLVAQREAASARTVSQVRPTQSGPPRGHAKTTTLPERPWRNVKWKYVVWNCCAGVPEMRPAARQPRCSLARFSIGDLRHGCDIIAHYAFAMRFDEYQKDSYLHGYATTILIDRRYAIRLSRVFR